MTVADREGDGIRGEASLREARPWRVDGRGEKSAGPTSRVGHEVATVVPREQHARDEGPQVQRVEVEHPSRLGVGGVEQLEAAVDGDAVDDLAAYPTAHRVGRLEHHHRASGCGDVTSGREPRQTRSHDDDIDVDIAADRGHHVTPVRIMT